MKSYNKFFNAEPKTDTRVAYTETKITPQHIPEEPPIKAVVICPLLNVRKTDSRTSDVICVIKEGETVTIAPIYNVDINENWAHIKLDDGREGYVMGAFIKQVK